MEPDLRTQIRNFEKTLPPLPPDQAELLKRASEELAASGIAQRALKAGDQAPDFTLPNAVGIPINLAGALKNGPAVVTFYRGIW